MDLGIEKVSFVVSSPVNLIPYDFRIADTTRIGDVKRPLVYSHTCSTSRLNQE